MIVDSKNKIEDPLKHVRETISKHKEAIDLQRIEKKGDNRMSKNQKDMAKKVVELVSTKRLGHDFQHSTKLMTV